jgi:HEAT repeat protein
VSRAAAVALVIARPRTPSALFAEALRSEHPDARANAAWALGRLGAPASMLLPLLRDTDSRVLQETLMGLARAPGDVDARMLTPLLTHPDPLVRGTAAIALAKHQPDVAAKALPAQLRSEVNGVLVLYAAWNSRGKTQLSADEIARIMGYYRCQMKLVQAISMLDGAPAIRALEEQAFRPGEDFAQMNGVVAAFQLWDRIGDDPGPAVEALAAQDVHVADKAEWMLVQAGPAVLPRVREALLSQNVEVRRRAIRILAWQGDLDAVQKLRRLQERDSGDAELLGWAIQKIQLIHPKLSTRESSPGQ